MQKMYQVPGVKRHVRSKKGDQVYFEGNAEERVSSSASIGKRVASPPARVEKVPPGDKDWANSTDHFV